MGSLFGFASLFCQLAGSILHFRVSRTYFLSFCISATDEGIDYKSLIESHDVNALAAAMNATTKFIIHNKNISIQNMKTIATALHSNISITAINLASNNIGDGGLKEIATALGTNKSVTTLNLTDNVIGDDGALALRNMLMTNETITNVNLSTNKIGDNGAKGIATALCRNKSVTTLKRCHLP